MNTLTAWFLLLVLMSAGVFDLWAFQQGGPSATITYAVHVIAARYPVIPLLSGIILGHLFWPSYLPADKLP